MGPKNRFKLSWELFKSSVSVMFLQKELLAFPIVITILTAGIALLFMSPVIVAFFAGWLRPSVGQHAYQWVTAHHWITPARWQSINHWLSANHWQNAKPAATVYFAVTYLVSMVAATFFNVAFYHEILEALKGHQVSIRNGLQFALTRWKSIILWSAFAGVVGFIISRLEQKSGFFGRLVFSLVGTAWSVACVFVIPVIVQDEETCNPIDVLQKSVAALKKTWGESLIAYAGITLGNWIVTIAAMLWVGGALLLAYKLRSVAIGAVAVFGGLLPIAGFFYLTSIANQVFRCALFLYASSGAMPRPFTTEMTALAWRTKRS